MNSQPQQLEIERLLAERAWVRRLAGSLVADAALADDLTQDAYVVALGSSAGAISRPRAWLGTVTRNLLRNRQRSEIRRRKYESQAPSTREVEPPDRAVARAELVERVVRLVLALPKPYRTTIVLRFFEDLPPRMVAARMSVPVETVRTRIRRALGTLEAQLDELHGGRRRPWVLALAPFAAPSALEAATGTTTAGVLIAMSKNMKLALALLLLAVAGVAVLWVAPWRAPTTTAGRAANDSAGSSDDGPGPILVGRADVGSPEDRSKVPTSRIFGRVVDERRRPQSGVMVAARWPEREALETRSDSNGRFTVETPDSWTGGSEIGVVLARASDGRVGVGGLPALRDRREIDAGTVVLEAGHVLEVHVRVGEGGRLPARLLAFALRPGGPVALLDTRTDAEGRALLSGLPRGAIRILALAEECGRGEARVWLPRFVPGPCVIELEPPRTVTLRIVDASTKEPIEGVTVKVLEDLGSNTVVPRLPTLEVPPSDADGQTELCGIGRAETPSLLLSGPGIPATNIHQGLYMWPLARVSGDVDTLQVQVLRSTPKAWRILEGDVRAPEEGSELRLAPAHETRAFVHRDARIQAGHVVASELARGWFVLTLDGRIGYLDYGSGADGELTTAFRKARTIDVLARFEDGTPAEGYAFRALGGNVNPVTPPATTDARGHARLTGLYGGVVELWRWYPASPWVPRAVVAELNLDAGDASVELTVPRPVTVRIRVTVAGEPRLPTTYTLKLTGSRITDVREDPAAATLAFDWLPAKATPRILHLESPEHGVGTASLPAYTSTPEVEIDLEPAGFVYVSLLPPADGRARVALEHQTSGSDWKAQTHLQAVGSPFPPDGHVRFGPLTPGRYRASDLESGASSAVVEVTPGSDPTHVTLDLRDIIQVRGRVVGPPETNLEEARVSVLIRQDESTDALRTHTTKPRANGCFELRVPASAEATVTVDHPVLLTAPASRRMPLTDVREKLVLRLVEGRYAVLHFDPPLQLEDRARSGTQIHLYRGEPDGQPHHELEHSFRDPQLRIVGYDQGTWTLWIDMGVDLPLVLRDVKLGAGKTDLGTVGLSRGSRLRVRIEVAEGHEPPFVSMLAERVEAPSYRRFLTSLNRERELELPGLLPGTWKLDFRNPTGRHLPDEVDVGVDDVVEVLLDLR